MPISESLDRGLIKPSIGASGTVNPAPLPMETSVSTPTGDITILGSIYEKWLALTAEKNAQSGHVQSYLGYPLAAQSAIPAALGGGTVQYFQRGMIAAKAKGGAFVVYGAIYVRYCDLGGLGSDLGLPASDEEAGVGGGRVSHFDKGDIYWRSDSGAHEVHGAIRERYNALGGPGGVLGYPATGETAVMQDKKNTGYFNRFANNGVIYWSQETGAWEVYGDIRDAWENHYKGVNGPLGFPIAAQTTMDAVKVLFVALPKVVHGSFQNGALVWHDSGQWAGMNLVTGLDVYVQRLEAKGSHGVWEWLGVAGNNLYVHVNIEASTGPKLADRMPANGDYGGGKDIQQNIFSIPIVRGDLTLNVSFDGWDRRPSSGDTELGKSVGVYNAQNLWGIGQVSSGWQGDFQATYVIKPHNAYDKAEFRQQMFWGFHNFDTPDMSWEEFAETYSDVTMSEDTTGGHIEHPFDYLFYKWVFEGLSKNGNCFGMCVESIYAQVGRSLFAEPIITYPQQAPETQEINIKMGYQLGGDLIDWFLGQFLVGNTHNPVNVFNASRDQFNRGDYPVITLTTDSMGADGHCVRPYAWFDGNFPGKPGKMVIKVANPNSPAPGTPDDDSSCLIEIDKAANTFTMAAAQGSKTIYSGGEWSGGRMLSVPFSQFSREPRTPFWEVLALLVAGTLIIFGGDGQTHQITDGSGKTFYEPNLADAPTRWTDVRKDASQRIPDMARIPLHSAPDIIAQPAALLGEARKTPTFEAALAARGHRIAPPAPPEVYYLHGDGGTLKQEVIGKKAGSAQWHMRAAGMEAVLTLAAEEGKTDLIQVNDVGRGSGSVTVTTAANGAPKAGVVSLAGGSLGPHFTLNNLTLTPGQPITFGLAAGSRGIVMQNAGPAVTFDLTVQSGLAAAQVHKGIALDAGKTAVLSHIEASPANPAAQVHLQVLDRPGGAVLSEKDLA